MQFCANKLDKIHEEDGSYGEDNSKQNALEEEVKTKKRILQGDITVIRTWYDDDDEIDMRNVNPASPHFVSSANILP